MKVEIEQDEYDRLLQIAAGVHGAATTAHGHAAWTFVSVRELEYLRRIERLARAYAESVGYDATEE